MVTSSALPPIPPFLLAGSSGRAALYALWSPLEAAPSLRVARKLLQTQRCSPAPQFRAAPASACASVHTPALTHCDFSGSEAAPAPGINCTSPLLLQGPFLPRKEHSTRPVHFPAV